MTPARPVTTPDAADWSGLLKVTLAFGAIAVTVVLKGMPKPVTIWPTERPAVLAMGRMVSPVGMVPVMVPEPAARMPVIEVPAGMPVPTTTWPTDKPVTSTRAMLFAAPAPPRTPKESGSKTAGPLVAKAAISSQPACTVVVPV